ncbi:hypothetical protein PGT21_013485 [Puccinia graminis f. sp. tritici]|uniref:Uncharacterized protein n=1 Tax=Puccinia graminis f. sp. tritici TaxID=56615 RepID=A0A5B0R297_PUCGR|nr:hypothetical protein PGT21_013485 [Puccinia graminis f. sp. tritici]
MAYHHQESTDQMLDCLMNFPSAPSLGSLQFPNNAAMSFLYDNIFNKETETGELLELILSNRYLTVQHGPMTWEEFNLAKMFDMCNSDFRRVVQTSKDSFMWLLR